MWLYILSYIGFCFHKKVKVYIIAVSYTHLDVYKRQAVLAAATIEPLVKEYIFPSAAYEEPIHKEQCRFLGIKPCLHYNLQIDEALGSTMGLSIIDASMHMLNDMKTFVEAEVKAAEDGAGKGRQKNKE